MKSRIAVKSLQQATLKDMEMVLGTHHTDNKRSVEMIVEIPGRDVSVLSSHPMKKDTLFLKVRFKDHFFAKGSSERG